VSLDGEGNFIAKWGVETTTPRVLRDGLSLRSLAKNGVEINMSTG